MKRSKPAVMAKVGEALDRLNQMREEEGRGIARELRERMAHLAEASKSVQQHRRAVLQNYSERLQSRLQELLGATIDKERVLQEAALLVDRSDIQEEIVRLETHVQHFLGIARARRRDRQEAGFPVAGNESRGQHPAFENIRPRGRSAEDHGGRTGDEIGNRKIARAGAKPGMNTTANRSSTSSRLLRVRGSRPWSTN